MDNRIRSGSGAAHGNDGAAEQWAGRVFYTSSFPPPAGAGKVWELRRGEWREVPDPVRWPADMTDRQRDEAAEAAGYFPAGQWGDGSFGRVALTLYQGRGRHLLLLTLADGLHSLLCDDLPSLLGLLPTLLGLVAADEALEAGEERRAAARRKRR